jgi:hypothetical protein
LLWFEVTYINISIIINLDLVLTKICNLLLTLKLLEILHWNLEYLWTIRIFININKTHNSTLNTYKVLPHFAHRFCKICTWSITLKLNEISTWNVEYISTINIFVINNKAHNSATKEKFNWERSKPPKFFSYEIFARDIAN